VALDLPRLVGMRGSFPFFRFLLRFLFLQDLEVWVVFFVVRDYYILFELLRRAGYCLGSKGFAVKGRSRGNRKVLFHSLIGLCERFRLIGFATFLDCRV
jgi:hypothetical protein